MHDVKNGEGSYWREWILNRPKKNKNCLLMVVGATGSGKSYACLRCAELLDPNFQVKHCYFKLVDLYKDMDSGELKKGDIVILEEIGVAAGSRKWQSKDNISFSEVLQTFRTKKLIVFLNLPMRYMADSHARSLMHCLWTMQSIDQSKGISYIKPFILQFNSRSRSERDSCYEKFLRVRVKNDWGFESEEPIKSIGFKKPSANLVKEYEIKKKAFVNELVKSKMEAEKKIEEKNKPKSTEPRKYSRPPNMTKDVDINLLRSYLAKGIAKTNIAKLLDISLTTLRKHIKHNKLDEELL